MTDTTFEPATLGPITLSNHVVMAPMTRCRAPGGVPNELMAEYYAQRAGAGLIISEGTSPSPDGLGYARIPGLFNADQAEHWKAVTDAVHAEGGRIFVQLMHSGRIFHELNLPAGAHGVAPSAIAAAGKMWTDQQQLQPNGMPRELAIGEIAGVVQQYAESARLAMQAGFDGVELHGANGYLLEQFLHPSSNHRVDAYGGSVEHRARFVLETVTAVANAIGAERTGIRLSPWGTAGDLAHYAGIDDDYGYLATELAKTGIVYLHLINHARLSGAVGAVNTIGMIRETFDKSIILTGNYHTLADIEAALEGGQADLVGVGRPFIANPDLVERLQLGLPLAVADPKTFYSPGPNGLADGYTTYTAGKTVRP